MKKRKIYTYESVRKIESQIPATILEAMNSKGWNAFGIYELVAEVLKQEKKEKQNETAKRIL
jgi:hypothetical protein